MSMDSQVIKLHFLLFLQQMLKEVCTSCLQPVYSRERVASDKVCLHHSCFCCQVCRKKLSLQNYAALHGVFYCQLHYKPSRGKMEKRKSCLIWIHSGHNSSLRS
uniref:LIM zinc-binding domain-containing protein n=1 Tax=Nothoprocta perdicaria TaxID=30464 RepID=A0A8C6Z808_NOTPE